jgi:hypothetical protein
MMPPVMTASDNASAARSRGELAIVSFSHTWAMPIETSGSSAVMTASTGAIRTPAWKALWFSKKPTGPMTTITYRGHWRSGLLNPSGRVSGTIFSRNALTPKSTPHAIASHTARTCREALRATARQPASTAASPAIIGRASAKVTVPCPPCGRATARKQAIPAAQQMTPASIIRSGRRCRSPHQRRVGPAVPGDRLGHDHRPAAGHRLEPGGAADVAHHDVGCAYQPGHVIGPAKDLQPAGGLAAVGQFRAQPGRVRTECGTHAPTGMRSCPRLRSQLAARWLVRSFRRDDVFPASGLRRQR